MKIKTIVILVVLAVLLGALARFTARKQQSLAAPSSLGAKVMPDLDVNRVGKIVITSREGIATIAKTKNQWVVASRFNYPANFDKVADCIRQLSEMKVGQAINLDASQLAGLNLVIPSPSGTNQPAGAGALVELRDEKDGLLASLVIGKSFMRRPGDSSMEPMMGFGGYPDGQYIQTQQGKVYLVSKTLDRLTESFKTWLADDLISVPSADMREISVSGPQRAALKLVRAKDGDALTLDDLRAEEGALDGAKANQMAGALSNLGLDDVADPALPEKITGLDRPIVFRAKTKEGLIYTLRLGNPLANDTFDRYLAISVTNEPAGEPANVSKKEGEKPVEGDGKEADQNNAVAKAAELNARMGGWVYVIKSYRAEPLLQTREEMIKKPEPPKTESAQTSPADKADEDSENNAAPGKDALPAKKDSNDQSTK